MFEDEAASRRRPLPQPSELDPAAMRQVAGGSPTLPLPPPVRFDFARAIVGSADRPRVTAITTAQYPTAARRPAYAVLAAGRFMDAFGFGLPDWRTMLNECLSARA